MRKTERLRQRIAGKTKQAVGEIIGDQELHEEGKAQESSGQASSGQESSGRKEQDGRQPKNSSGLNPLKKLNQLT